MRIPPKEKSLGYLNPELAAQWHPVRNASLTPNQVTIGSGKKIWWQCPESELHVWLAQVCSRARKQGGGCPFCSGKKVCADNSLSSLLPGIAADWHSTKNQTLMPDQVTAFSSKKAWWQCPKRAAHVWEAPISQRTGQSQGCPFCSGQRVCADNNLAVTRPGITAEWHPTKNKELKPSQVTKGSNKKAWWQCPKSELHVWESTVKARTRKIGGGCPFCRGLRICSDNNLAVIRPDIAAYWHPTKNQTLTPEQVTVRSDKKAWWQCPKSSLHVWEASISNRARKRGGGCPFCRGLKVCSDNNLATLRPDIAKEWHSTKNQDLTPDQVTIGSGEKAWWQCPRSKSHVWLAHVVNRTRSNGSGCPNCFSQTSLAEIRLYTELAGVFDDCQQRNKIHSKEIDVYIKKYKIGVEYDGVYWHQDKVRQDLDKNLFFEKHNIKLVRIREKPLSKLSDLDVLTEKDKLRKSDINAFLVNIRQLLDRDDREKVDNYIKYRKYRSDKQFRYEASFLPSPIPSESLAHLKPEIAAEWHPTKNYPRLPEHFSRGSDQKIWWQCPKSELHVWQATIYTRTNGGGCPFCSGKKVCADNNLVVLRPDISAEWHPTKNSDLTPEEVTVSSNKKVWWQCLISGSHVWESLVNSRNSGSGCPFCAGNLPSEENNLAVLRPDIAAHWHLTKNKDLTPEQVTVSSTKIVWWQCSKSNAHVWSSRVHNRTRHKGFICPFCSMRKVCADNNLAVARPDIALEWHPTKNPNLSPEQVTSRSSKKVWWQCKKNKKHEWQTSVGKRTQSNGTGCAECYMLSRSKESETAK